MTIVEKEREELVVGWIRYASLPKSTPSEEREKLFDFYEQLHDLVWNEPEDAWIVINDIRVCVPNQEVLANLGAGPLEDLLAQHGPLFIDRVETLARQDPSFRLLLGIVWQNAMTDEIWSRVQAVAGPTW